MVWGQRLFSPGYSPKPSYAEPYCENCPRMTKPTPDYVEASLTTPVVENSNAKSGSVVCDIQPLYDNPASLHPRESPHLPQLPPFASTKQLFWVQYSYMGTFFSLIDPATFEKRLNQVYYDPMDRTTDHRLACCQVLLVIAFGLMYSVNQWSGDGEPPGFKYFEYALQFLPDIHEGGSIFFVEVLCYVSYYR